MSTTQKERDEVLHRLDRLGISSDDANTLRRISLTLSRWFELECGDGNEWASWSIERDETTGKPYKCIYSHTDKMRRDPIADRETGARLRLAKLMAKYPGLIAYIQTDPRGASLYILTLEQLGQDDIESVYSRGVAVY